MRLLRIDSSITGPASASRELTDIAEAAWREEHPGGEVITRDLAARPIPAETLGLALSGAMAPEADRSPEQISALLLATEIVDEITGTDAVLIGSPLYNYGISQHFKTWVDLAHIDPRSSGGANPILEGTPTVLVSTRGGSYGPGTPREGWDHATPYARRILGDLWGAELEVIERELTLAAVKPEMERYRDHAEDLHAAARDAAHAAGRDLARRSGALAAS